MLNLENIDPKDCGRVVDLLSGAAFALQGQNAQGGAPVLSARAGKRRGHRGGRIRAGTYALPLMMEKEKDASARAFEFAAGFAADKGICRFTRFLDPAQAASAAAVARGHGVRLRRGADMSRRSVPLAAFFPAVKR